MSETQAVVSNQVNPVVQSTLAPDRVGNNKTIYDVGAFEIFWRNLIAGMGRAMGSILLYFIFLFVIGFLFAQLVWPTLKPMVDGYMSLVDSVNSLQNIQPSNSFDTGDIESLLKSYGIN